jgi:hypothetical protein
MESIYWVMCWACHRKCRHCYESRFRPYVRDELEAVIAQAETNTRRVMENLPASMAYLDTDDTTPDGRPLRKIGRVILSGGESLLEGVRQRVTYKVIEGLVARYAATGGVKIVVQTTGDLLTSEIVADLLARGVWMISVAGVDDFHVGMEGEAKQEAYKGRLRQMMSAQGMIESGLVTTQRKWLDEPGPLFSFFGATPDTWIGKLWPRGRSWENGLSTATLGDNFCARWSGGRNFLNHAYSGSEVSIEPDGAVYPCCIKTKLPIGNLVDERLIDILDSLVGDPVYEALNAGQPERMGIAAGWSVADFLEKSRTTTPQGKPYANLCIGCDRFHAEILAPRIEAARMRRRQLESAT